MHEYYITREVTYSFALVLTGDIIFFSYVLKYAKLYGEVSKWL